VDGRAVMTYRRPKFLKARALLAAGRSSGTVREAQTTSEVYVKHVLKAASRRPPTCGVFRIYESSAEQWRPAKRRAPS
jgi:hypothetical protein